MGLSAAARAYWRSIERAGLGGSNDSEETSSVGVKTGRVPDTGTKITRIFGYKYEYFFMSGRI
jgi:hypothetical protein